MAKIVTAKEMSVKWPDYQRKRQNEPEKYRLFSTGLKVLDAKFSGGHELGTYNLIGGAEKDGKTTLLMHIAESYGKQGLNTLFFSNEMWDMQIGSMIFSTFSKVERTKIRALEMDASDWKKIETAAEEIEQLTLTFDFGTFDINNVPDAIRKVEAITGKPVQAIFCDYFHLFEDVGFRGNKVDELSGISKKFKRLTHMDDFLRTVWVAVHINREGVKGHIISASYLLGTGALERDADSVSIIHKVKDPVGTNDEWLPNVRAITVTTSRETGIGECRVEFNGATASLSDKIEVVTKPPPRNWSD